MLRRSRLLLAHCSAAPSASSNHNLAAQPLAAAAASRRRRERSAIKMATSAELYAAAQILGSECAAANMAFLKCKAEAQHPRHCLEAGTAVTFCAVRNQPMG